MNRLLKIISIVTNHGFGKRDAGLCRRFCRDSFMVSVHGVMECDRTAADVTEK
jgi:hypothetical protein